MSEITTASNRLFGKDGMNATNFNIFHGSNENITAEQITTEINKVLSQVEAGDFEVVEL